MRKSKKNNFRFGFTLVELLVVMAILGILMVVSLANFRTSQIKARDVQRKHDLKQIAIALEAYMTDHGGYPNDNNPTGGGKIKACGCKSAATADACDWDQDEEPSLREFCDENSTVYMSKVPGDPGGSSYCYYSEGNLFRIYAILENANDPEILGAGAIKSCVGYNFGISSPNTTP